MLTVDLVGCLQLLKLQREGCGHNFSVMLFMVLVIVVGFRKIINVTVIVDVLNFINIHYS